MTPPDLTQPQRLDLEEGKRLLSEWRKACRERDQGAGVLCSFVDAWFLSNADMLLSAAEEAEKLRKLLREVRASAASWDAGSYVEVQLPTVLLQEIDAILTPPEPQITVKEQ